MRETHLTFCIVVVVELLFSCVFVSLIPCFLVPFVLPLCSSPLFFPLLNSCRHGRKADIWSVAGTVLNMFTGVPPWSGGNSRSANVMALLLQIERSEGPPPYPEELYSPYQSKEDGANVHVSADLCCM